ncbi:protocadherin Fat 4-like [Haliotis asinina]|uniref:protocadherin Fat 4-like n=1 Tax=Haliotis asinina TaxID=109174 RepID=UPI00353182ED
MTDNVRAPSGPLPEVNLGQNCSYALCAPVNSACITKVDNVRTCECVNKHLQMNSAFCKRAPDEVTKESSFTFNVSTGFTGEVAAIPFDGLLEFPRNFFTLTVDLIPRDENIKLTTSSDKVTLTLTAPLQKPTTSALTMIASTAKLSVTDTDTVTIMVNEAPITRNITMFLVQGTRRNTLIADVRAEGFEFQNGAYTFSIESSDEAELFFSVDEHSGRVVCREDIIIQSDEVIAREYTLKVVAIATSGSAPMDLIRANILVLKHLFEIVVNENEKAIIMRYELQSDSFRITTHDLPSDIINNDGVFQLMSPRDYEGDYTRSTFSLHVQTIETIPRQTYISVSLNVKDLNDEPPRFQKLSYEFTILAGSYVGTIIGSVSSIDPDTVGGTHYNIEGMYKDLFHVDPSGTIQSKVELEKERFGERFSMSIAANDGQQTSSSKAVVNVNLITIYPEAENLHINFTVKIPEEEPTGGWVTDVKTAGYSKYRFSSKHAGQLFNLNSTTGQITTKRPLDRESLDASYAFFDMQAVKDNEDQCTLVTLGRLVYELQDVNDNYPMFSRRKYSGQVPENSQPYTDVSGMINLHASDADIGENARLTFALTGSGSDYFKVVNYTDNNVKIMVAKPGLDRELMSSYLLTLTATDNPVSPNARNSNSTLLNITILDENDNDPVCDGWPTTFYVLENVGFELLTTLSSTDKDEGPNADIIYSVLGGGWTFSVEREEGKVYKNHPIDRESFDEIQLTFEARDKGIPSRSCERNVTIYINDTNDNAPVFENGISYIVINRPEDQDCSKLNITITANDPDKGLNGTVEYSLNNAHFSINKVSGDITCNEALDYERENTHELVVIATDKGDEPMSSSLTVVIRVKDINDNVPAFSKQSYNTSILTSEWVDGKPILVLKVSDQDSGPNGDIVLSLNNYSQIFKVTSGKNGVLRVKGHAPAAGTVYTFNITATDKGHPQNTNTTLVQVRVGQNEDKNPIQFNTTEFQFDLEEETNHTGTVIGQVQAEVSKGIANYQFVEGYDENVWVNSSTGEIFCDAILDREEKQWYKLVVRALPRSGGRGGDVAIVTVNVRDINDNHPVFTVHQDQLLFQIAEDAGIGTFIANVTASDPDEGNNGTLTYNIWNKDEQTPFVIEELDGGVKTSDKIDRERTPKYTLTIQAKDRGNPTLSAVTNVTILVLDINDNPPTFSPRSYTKTIKENAPRSTLLDDSDVFATDLDYNDNGTVTYVSKTTLVSNTTISCPFSLTNKYNQPTNEVIGVMAVHDDIDYETTPVYECYVTAVDMSRCSGDECRSRLTGTATVTVNVLDVNDNTPAFEGAPYNANVTRDSPIEFLVTDVIKASDNDSEDGNGIVRYNITDGSGSTFFRINPTSGDLYILKDLSSLDQDSVTLTVEARDSPINDEQLKELTTITIEILDDNPRPWFPKAQTMQVREEASPDGTSLSMTASDRKQGKVTICNCTYELTSDISSSFFINKTTGDFTQSAKVNRESTGSTFKIEVKASDDGDPPKTATAFVTINVIDINDNRPYFNKTLRSQTFSVAQTAPIGSLIGRVVSIDEDEDHNSITIYETLIIDERIILHENGTIVVNKSLINHEEENYKIEFSVSARDSPPLQWSSDTSENYQSTLVMISVNYSDPNEHPPTFIKAQYNTQVQFTSRRGTEIKPADFKAFDKDGDNISYAITHGNIRDIIAISAESGLMKLQYDLDSTIDELINLTVTATDNALYPKTGTCQVLIMLKDMEDTQCIPQKEYSQLGKDSELKTTFMTLFGVMTALLVLAVITVLFSCYKWCVSSKAVEQYKQKNNRYSLVDKERQSKPGENYEGLQAYVQEPQHDYRHHETIDFSSPDGVINPAYIRAATGRNLRGRQVCRPPSGPVQGDDKPAVDTDTVELEYVSPQHREYNS